MADTDLRRVLISSIFSGRSSAKRSFRVCCTQNSQQVDSCSYGSSALDHSMNQTTTETEEPGLRIMSSRRSTTYLGLC